VELSIIWLDLKNNKEKAWIGGNILPDLLIIKHNQIYYSKNNLDLKLENKKEISV